MALKTLLVLIFICLCNELCLLPASNSKTLAAAAKKQKEKKKKKRLIKSFNALLMLIFLPECSAAPHHPPILTGRISADL